LHTVDMLCIDYYEARQRKNRANSWNDCHSRVEVSRQQAQKKICWDFEREFFITSVWLQAGQYLALAAQIPAKQKSGCRPLSPILAQAEAEAKAGAGSGAGRGICFFGWGSSRPGPWLPTDHRPPCCRPPYSLLPPALLLATSWPKLPSQACG
jgi:hypothetical protein